MEDTKERRSPRLVYPSRIRVIGQDKSGHNFFEDTCTLVVNREGARIHLHRDPDPRKDIFILSFQTDEGGRFRVVGERGEADGDGKSWGVELVKAPQKMKTRNIWGSSFPPSHPTTWALSASCWSAKFATLANDSIWKKTRWRPSVKTEAFSASAASASCPACGQSSPTWTKRSLEIRKSKLENRTWGRVWASRRVSAIDSHFFFP